MLPFERSSLTHWRQRLGEEQLSALIQESLSVAHKTGGLGPKDLERVAVDTTVQPKNVGFPTDAKLMHKAIVMLGREARTHDVPLRQSYVRVTKTIRREMKRRAAVEPVIGHVKAEHRMERNYLKGSDGDRAGAVLAAAGYNFRLLIRWSRRFCAP